MTIEQNIENILAKIRNAARISNRNTEEVQLIAVTKTIDVDTIKKAIDYGLVHIGENKVQELLRKYEDIGPGVKWHLIGHLQRNKVKYIIDKVDLIHSLDSYRLAVEIDKRAKEVNRVMECLLQVNVSKEETKYGIHKEEVLGLLKEIEPLENVKIVGLMTMAPYSEDPEDARPYFRELKALSHEISQLDLKNVEMKYLSMGMSNDFEVAIEEGANLVRVGSAIFGERDYSK